PTIIIEHRSLRHPGPGRVSAEEPRAALDVRMIDRFCDNYSRTPMQKIVSDSIRAPEHRDRQGVAEARKTRDTAYRWLEDAVTEREWATGNAFSLADCAAAPALFYADWTHPIGKALSNVHAYRRR